MMLSLQIRKCVGLVSNYDDARREREGDIWVVVLNVCIVDGEGKKYKVPV